MSDKDNKNTGDLKNLDSKVGSACPGDKGDNENIDGDAGVGLSESPGQGQPPKTQVDEKAVESDDEEIALLMGICSMKDESGRPEPISGTSFLYDEIMTKYKCEWDPNFVERPERITLPFARCKELGLVDRCQRLELRYASEDHVCLQHSAELLDIAKSATTMSLEELKSLSVKYDSFYCSNWMYECALASLGGTLETMEHILKKKVRNGFAMVRPPGHHAMYNDFCGYCVFNNVAIAARHALDHRELDRILIVDWDVHHGHGTQYMFYDDPRVLYFSIHRYEYGTFWPYLRESDYDFIGQGKGAGFNINVPLNKFGVTDSDYMAILHQILLPVAYEFSPQLVLVSCGYDAAVGCPEGEMLVTPAAYAHFTHMLSLLCEGRVCIALEGGYCLKSLAEGCALTLRELLGDPCPLIKPTEEPSDSVTETILNLIKLLRQHWTCFQYQKILDDGELCPFDGVNTLPPRQGVTFMTPENHPEFYDFNCYPVQSSETALKFDMEIQKLISETNLSFAKHRTCLVFDAEMRAHRDKVFKSHPERPDRISRIYNQHVEWGLLSRCLRVQSRLATEEEIATIHSQNYIDELRETEQLEQPQLMAKQLQFQSIYICKETFHCALLSAGSVLNVVDTVLSGKAQNGVAIVRPPGHHAEHDKCKGFCYFNNLAIAVKYAQDTFGVKRVLIVDWDVHHGNGTQHQFYDDPSVLFISLHRYDNGFFYPTSPEGNYDHVGNARGEGYNINVSWSQGPMGSSEYIAAFQQIIMPVAYEFAPELVLVSAGYDAAQGDPLGGYQVTPEGYGHMTHMLSSLANGRVVLILEGGYNLNSISISMATCTSVLLGDPCPILEYSKPRQSAIGTICDVLDAHKKYWKSLKFRVGLPSIAQMSLIGGKSENQSKARAEDGAAEPVDVLTDNIKDLSVSKKEEKYEENVHKSVPGDEMVEASQGSITEEETLGACGGQDNPKTVMEFLHLPNVDQMFAVQPLPWCPHLWTVHPVPDCGLDTQEPCAVCGDISENWVCLVCYKVFCSRFVNEHMLFHGIEEEHKLVLSYSDLSVWCYACDHYIDNKILHPMKQAAHQIKFGEDLPHM